MNATTLLDDATAQSLDAAWLKDAIAPAGSFGARSYASRVPFVPGQEAQARAHAERIARVARALDVERIDAARDVLRRAPDISSALARASMGDDLDDPNFLELQRFFDACVQVDALTEGAGLPRIATEDVRACASSLERGRSGRFGFYLDDAFDAGLAAERAAFSKRQAEYDAIRGRQTAALAQQLGRDISGNEFIVMRDERRLPLPAGVRVVREAPTYLLCELDADDAVIEAIAKRDAAASRVALAESRVRRALTAIVRTHAAAIDAACDALADVDCIIACARFTLHHECCVPDYVTGARFEVRDARFVPLAVQLEREGRAFTPISVSLDGIAVITGPNMGGKSASLRTCGFIALCAAFGLPVPAAAARVPLFAQIAWLGIGANDAQGGLLSAFALEVVRLEELLSNVARPRLIFMDEFARTTTPREGKALVVAIVRCLRREGALGLVATHVDGVAAAAGVKHYAVRGLKTMPAQSPGGDLHAALASLGASMDYTLEEVGEERRAGADAIALAALLGIDPAVIADAYAELEEEEWPY